MKYTREVVLALGFIYLFCGLEGPVQVFFIAACVFILLAIIDTAAAVIEAKSYLRDTAHKALQFEIQDLYKKVEEADSHFLAIQGQVEGLTKNQAAVKTMAEESKKLISQANLGMGFRAAKREA